MELSSKRTITNKVVNGIFLAVLNLALMLILGYLTLDIHANQNSRFAGYLLSFFIPFFIVYKTSEMNDLERMLKFGSGYMAYIILSLAFLGLPKPFMSSLLPCLLLSLAVLYYGKSFLNLEKQKDFGSL
jgi:hypothetical protein